MSLQAGPVGVPTPAETHQLGRAVDEEDVLALLCALLDVPDGGETTTLAELGADPALLDDLWGAACEEYAERSLGPELDPESLDPSMTLASAASTMAALLRAAGGGAA